jgi:hypothetical protein
MELIVVSRVYKLVWLWLCYFNNFII